MSAMSNYLENKIVDHVFRGAAYTIPVIYVGLFTAAPSDAAGGTEVSGSAYARVKAAASTAQALGDWKSTQNDSLASSGTGGNTTNTAAVTFPTPTATWGTVTHFGIFDQPTGINLLFWGALTIAKTINQDDTVTFPAGTLSITFA